MAETRGMSPIERAARALHADTQQFRHIRDPEFPNEPPAVQQSPFIEWEMLPQDAKERYFGQARAVLQAVREPSALMKEKGVDALDSDCHFECSGERAWRAMIDAALEER